nr:hypothetical protein Iba_scaffold23279CG0010 [Ipomoea batatas]
MGKRKNNTIQHIGKPERKKKSPTSIRNKVKEVYEILGDMKKKKKISHAISSNPKPICIKAARKKDANYMTTELKLASSAILAGRCHHRYGIEVIRISPSIRSVVTSSPAIMVLQFAAVTDDMIFTYSDPLLISLLAKLAARVYAQNPTKSSSLSVEKALDRKDYIPVSEPKAEKALDRKGHIRVSERKAEKALDRKEEAGT